jgi:hypothetical protein
LGVVVVVVEGVAVVEVAPNAPPRRSVNEDDSKRDIGVLPKCCCCKNKVVVVVVVDVVMDLTGRLNGKGRPVVELVVMPLLVVVVVVANPVAKTVSKKKNNITNQDEARFNMACITTNLVWRGVAWCGVARGSGTVDYIHETIH